MKISNRWTVSLLNEPVESRYFYGQFFRLSDQGDDVIARLVTVASWIEHHSKAQEKTTYKDYVTIS